MKKLLMICIGVFLMANEVAIVRSIEGIVTAKDINGVRALIKGDKIQNGMIIVTEVNSKVKLTFNDNSNLMIGQNSLINIDKFIFKPIEKEYKFNLSLEKGSASFESGKIGKLSPQSFSLKTPDGIVGIRGTKFIVKVE